MPVKASQSSEVLPGASLEVVIVCEVLVMIGVAVALDVPLN
jgi:hypothetical protein